MEISLELLTPLISEFVPVIVNAAMSSIEASALGRELTDAEIDKIMNDVNSAVDSLIVRLQDEGITVDELIQEELRLAVYESAWTLIQEVTEELKRRTECTRQMK